jgi:hypothetical protein
LASFVGVKSKDNSELNKIQGLLKSLGRCFPLKVQDSRFKLGSLDSMLINLEKIKKLETASENLLKRIFKVYLEVEPRRTCRTRN